MLATDWSSQGRCSCSDLVPHPTQQQDSNLHVGQVSRWGMNEFSSCGSTRVCGMRSSNRTKPALARPTCVPDRCFLSTPNADDPHEADLYTHHQPPRRSLRFHIPRVRDQSIRQSFCLSPSFCLHPLSPDCIDPIRGASPGLSPPAPQHLGPHYLTSHLL